MNKKIVLLAFIFSLVVFLPGCFNKVDKQKVIQKDPVVKDEIVPEAKKPTPDGYESAVVEIFTANWEQGNVTELKEQLLNLKTPGDYLDFHLNLAIALELIEQGRKNADQAKIEEGLEKINSLRQENEWFK